MRRGYPTNGGSWNSPINDYAAAASPASPTSPRPSPPGPLTGTRTRNPSSGKPPQPTSSPKSNAGATPSTRSNQRRTTRKTGRPRADRPDVIGSSADSPQTDTLCHVAAHPEEQDCVPTGSGDPRRPPPAG